MKPLLLVPILALVGCSQLDQASTTTLEPMAMTTSTTVRTTTSSVEPATTTSTTSLPDVDGLNVLFIGNSHTSTHDVPRTVEALLTTAAQEPLHVAFLSASFLRVAANDEAITNTLASGVWDFVILQGQEISQSHTIAYSQDEAVALARLAIDSGARPLFFSEWRRMAVDETDYIEGIYDAIAQESGAEVVPVGRSWDRFLSREPDHALWAADGNHSSADGAFLAAASIAYYIASPEASLTAPTGFEGLLEVSRQTIEDYLDSLNQPANP